MAIHTNLTGTFSDSFQLGKSGIVLRFDGEGIVCNNITETELVPVSVKEPTKPEHAVPLSFLSTYAAIAPLYGVNEPTNDIGVNTQVYYQLNDTNIVQIFFKHNDIWKPFIGALPPEPDSVIKHIFTGVVWTDNGNGTFRYDVPSTIHGGTIPIVQIYQPDGTQIKWTVEFDGLGGVRFVTHNPLNIFVVLFHV